MCLQRLALFSMLFACILRTATAQERDLFGMFGDAVRSGIAAAVQADWERLPDPEVACVDRALQQKGSSINDVIRQGISPADRRLAGLRAACRTPMPFIVDGWRLGDSVPIDSAAYLDYRCNPSEQFAGLTSCQRRRSDNTRRRPYQSTSTVLHAADGTALYIERLVTPAFFGGNAAMDDIRRLAMRYGEPRFMPAQRVAGASGVLIAYWGDIVLDPLDRAQLDDLAAGRNVHAGLLIDPLGDLQRSAGRGLPIYRLSGGAGYVWAASWDQTERGTLRIVAVDASRLPAPVVKPEGNADANAATDALKQADASKQNVAANSPPAAANPAPAPTPSPPPAVAAPPAAAGSPQPKPEANVETPARPRMVSPTLVNRTVTADPNAAGQGNGFGWALVGIATLLLAAAGYLLLKRRKRSMSPSAMFTAPAMCADRQVKVIVGDAPRGPLADVKHDPAHEVIIEPVSMTEAITAPAADTATPKTAETVDRSSRTASA